MRSLFVFLSVLFAWVPSVSLARIGWRTPGEYRLYTYLTDGFSLSEDESLAEQSWLRHRLRLKPTMELGKVSVFMELDVLSGQILGTTHTVGSNFEERRHIERGNRFDGWTTLEPRQLWFEVKGPYLTIRMGQMAVNWGLGIVSGRKTWAEEGHVRPLEPNWNGDLVDQVEITVKPFAKTGIGGWSRFELSLSAGSTFQDEHASLLDGGDAVLFSGALELPLDSLSAGSRLIRKVVTRSDAEVVDYFTSETFLRLWQPLFDVDGYIIASAGGVFQSARVEDIVPDSDGANRYFRTYAMTAGFEYGLNCPQVGISLDAGLSTGDGGERSEGVFQFDPDFAPTVIALPVVDRWRSASYAQRRLEQDGAVRTGDYMLASDGAFRSMAYGRLMASGRYRRFDATVGNSLLWRTGNLRSGDPSFSSPSIGEAAFVGNEVHASLNFEVKPQSAWRIGIWWAHYFPRNLVALSSGVAHTSVRSELRW